MIPEWHLLNYEYITSICVDMYIESECGIIIIIIDVLASVCLLSSRARINSKPKLNHPYAHLIVIPTSIKAFNFAECLSFTFAQNVSGVIPDCYILLFAFATLRPKIRPLENPVDVASTIADDGRLR